MKNSTCVVGQLNLFDSILEISDSVVTCQGKSEQYLSKKETRKDIVQEKENCVAVRKENCVAVKKDGCTKTSPLSHFKPLPLFESIFDRYVNNCIKMVERRERVLLVYLEDRTLYYNKEGECELILKPNTPLCPSDKILYSNMDFTVNDIQLSIANDMNATSYVKRKGDCNIYLELDDILTITPEGYILNYKSILKYLPEEKVNIECSDVSKSNKSIVAPELQYTSIDSCDNKQEQLEVGDCVSFDYKGDNVTGIITRIYNNGDTVNVLWDNKSTAYYYKSVTKIKVS